MDQEARLRRREEARRRLYRQRRLALAAVVAGVIAVLAALVSAFSGGGGPGGEPRDGSPPPAELPRGGRAVFPRHQVVGFYGAPQDDELGALGIGSPDEAARRLIRQARGYERGGRPVLPVLELIATVAESAPGQGERYSSRQPDAVVRRYLRAARRAKALLMLDIQPGRADFMGEVRHFARFLSEPDVSLALDPEWHVGRGEVPGQQIGSVDADTVNEVSAYLADIVKRRRLPQKLLLVHQFTEGMIKRRERLRPRPGVALTLNSDGFGNRPNKVAKYRELAPRRGRFHAGFKLFFREDTQLMGPRDVLRLRPRPEVVVYE